MATVYEVNKELKKRDIAERLAKGKGGYYFFSEGKAHTWPSSSIMADSLRDWTVEEVIAEYHRLELHK